MGLLKSANVPGIDFYEYRDQEYYGKYIYRARFNLEGIRYTWWAKTIDDIKERLKLTRGYNTINKHDREVLKENIDKIEAYMTWRDTHSPKKSTDKKVTVRVEYNTCAVFSNDLQLLKTLDQLYPGVHVDYTEVQTSNFAGVKQFVKEPKHKYRVYLKSKRIEEGFVTDLKDLFKRMKGLHPSPALKIWLKYFEQASPGSFSYWRYRYASSTHFIDYDDESTLSYLALLHGEMLGKKYKLEKRPDPV